MWQYEVLDVLCQQELDHARKYKLEDMDEKNWTKLNLQACSTIQLSCQK